MNLSNYINKKYDKERLQKITERLSDNQVVTKDIINEFGNETTKCVIDENIKNSYYVYLNDTIYLSKRNDNEYSRICLIAHECIHSIQSKLLQKLNFGLSNIELISFILVIIFRAIFGQVSIIPYVYMGIVILSIIPRMILEMGAVKASVSVAKKYLNDKINDEDLEYISMVYVNQVKQLLPLFILNLFFWKIIRALVIFVIYNYS